MKNRFKEYKVPSTRQIKKIWGEAIFVPDACLLLSLYRYPESTKDALIKIFKTLDNRMWIPHQVAFEYYKNRLNVVYEQESAYDSFKNILSKSSKAFNEEIRKFTVRHPYVDKQEIVEKFDNFIDQLNSELKQKQTKHPKWKSKDNILKALESIFKSNIGDPYPEEELKKLYSKGESRYAINIPPGFADAKEKPVPDKYGDFIIWQEMINKAKKEKKPIIFITDEKKPDWWKIVKNKTIGPLFELKEEFKRETGFSYYSYHVLPFVDQAKITLGIDITEEVRKELKEIESLNLEAILAKYSPLTSELVSGPDEFGNEEYFSSGTGPQGPITNMVDEVTNPESKPEESAKSKGKGRKK